MPRIRALAALVALVGVAAALAGCGGSGESITLGKCTLFQRSSQRYFVKLYSGTVPQVRQDCVHAASRLSYGERGPKRWVEAASDSGYPGDVRLCTDGSGYRSATPIVSLYARPSDASARALCPDLTMLDAPGMTVVLRSTIDPSQPFYVAIHGPKPLVEDSARHFPPPKQLVQSPRGTEECQNHEYGLTITAYSPSKNAAAIFCRSIG